MVKSEKFIVKWYFFVLKLGQKEYMVVLPWMIIDFKWRGKQIKASLYRIVEICVHGIALFKILF